MPSLRKLRRFRFRLIVAEEYQPVGTIPLARKAAIWGTVLVALAIQVSISLGLPRPTADAIELNEPPHRIAMVGLAAGDPVTFGKMTTLWLQAFDNQQGQSVSFRDLDYRTVAAWLGAILRLDERAQYPLFNAIRVYGFILNDPERVRVMIEFVRDEFGKDPANRWEWMAAATTKAKNEVEDLDLALELARSLREKTEGIEGVPNWARQMEPFLLSDKNEFDESAEMLMQLLNSGEVTDPQEFVLLYTRLEDIFTKMIEEGQVSNEQQYRRMEADFEAIRQRYLALQEE